MAIFKLSALDGGVVLIVRARCLTCARQVAIDYAGPEGTRVWASRSNSTVDLIRDPESHGYLSEGKSGLIKRIEHDSTE
ncbi:hypothetical protein [Eoetvoesiella caeni]|uniref:Uncharacterized protein n=1 Tax=Eoetvoesiella caeni TaxID=645616 RepID=A0A366HAD3_9BURK|nr:hypothetical protein [Eoetvoesiella caeni]MCI2809379.1 hypothetical protein [Eoetvoesiella caeni]NYT54520.1 hypothetical protein [Eoetvoesiella caeni]RBP39290.1 hypothetical protein DFR37_10581 [Eoetvoesiella caeni]